MKKIITLIIVLAAVLSLAVPAFAAPAPVPGAPAWDAAKYASAKVIAPSLGPDKDLPNNPRDNASGDKISSNAHSADFPGIYFYWNDKQKDNGVLLVEEWVFDLFVEGKFTLTAKNSNNYWGYSISPAAAQKIGGVYAFGISKQIKYNEIGNNGKISSKTDDLKNINMVFIDGKYKPGYVEIAKNWFDEEGEAIADRAALDAQLSFNGSYKLGINEIKISNYSEAVNGKKVTIMESAPDGFIERDGKSIQTVTVKHSDDPIKVVTFNNRKQYAKIEIVKVWLDEDGEKITDADILAELEANFEISGAAAFLGINLVKEGAYIVSEVDPLTAGFTLVGDNDIEVDVKAGKKITVTFENKEDPIITRKFGADIEKWVDGQLIAEFYGGLDDEEYAAIFAMMSFKLYKVDAKGGVIEEENFIADGALEFSGIISFGGLELEEEGWYAIVEELTDEGKELFVEADPLYVYVSALGVHDREPYAWVSGVDFGVPVYHSGAGVNYILPDVWDEVLSGQPAYEALKKMGALWVWDAVDTYQYGESGSVYTDEFTFTADEAGTVTGFLAADNAAVVYVNGKLAGYTTVAFNTPGNIPAENLADFNYGAMDASVFDGGWAEGWNHSYAFDINYNEGENTVTIIAANSARTSGTGTANDGYDDTNNPCGLLFGFITPPDAIFENSTIVTRQFGVDIEKWVDGESIVVWALDNGYDDLEALLSFDLYKFDDDADDWVWVADGALSDGIITFGNLEAGDYKLVETLTPEGAALFVVPDDLFFTIDEDDYEGVFENHTPIPVEPHEVYDKIPSKTHADRWWNNFGILAYGASSNQDKADYFIAFAEDFWDKNESVTIGFGTKGNWQQATIYLDEDGNLACDGISFREQQVGGSVNFDQHYTGKAKNQPFAISIGAYFDNPHGSGSMQLWLLSIQPKAGTASDSAEDVNFNMVATAAFFMPFDLLDGEEIGEINEPEEALVVETKVEPVVPFEEESDDVIDEDSGEIETDEEHEE